MTPDEQAFLAKKKEKAAARRAKPEDKSELGLTSLMDIVSIIVVYLLKSYASDPVVISPTAGQKIPLSTADSSMQDGIPIFVVVPPQGRDMLHDKTVSNIQEIRARGARTIVLAEGFPADAPLRRGTASNRPFSVRALLYVPPGHVAYHLGQLRERYLGASGWPS